MRNKLMNLLLRGKEVPAGWGFPPIPPALGSSVALRSSLMFCQDTDGRAQLARWYFSLLRSTPWAWRVLSNAEGYLPSLVYKAAVDSPSIALVRDPRAGRLELTWTPGPAVRSLTGRLQISDGVSLELGGSVYALGTQETATHLLPAWPAFLGCTAAIAKPAERGEHAVHFRPRRFDAHAIVQLLEAHAQDLDAAGYLDTFLSVPRAEEKISVAWLALSRLEEHT